MRYLTATLAVTALSTVALAAPAAPTAPVAVPANFMRQADRIPGSYIVVLKEPAQRTASRVDLDATIDRLAIRHTASVGRRYTTVHGFVAHMTEADALALAADPTVAHVEEDGVVHGDAIQTEPSWGLDRLDQPALPLDSSYAQVGQGAGATVYVIDSGIHPSHAEFAGRLLPGISFVADAIGTADCSGHGTHVAGTIGGVTFGVAKQVGLVPVRVLDCNTSGSISNIIAGIDWVAANHRPGSVANLSVGSSPSLAEDAAVRRLIASGVAVIVSAGNDHIDACTRSPGRTAEAITVAATNNVDARAEFSNSGTCVDIYAPGDSIRSAAIASDTANEVMSGTSMAAPHVAGVAALYVAANPSATPAQVTAALLDNAVRDTVTDTEGSPNLMINSNFVDRFVPGDADDLTDDVTAAADGGCQVGGSGAGLLVALGLVGLLRRTRRIAA